MREGAIKKKKKNLLAKYTGRGRGHSLNWRSHQRSDYQEHQLGLCNQYSINISVFHIIKNIHLGSSLLSKPSSGHVQQNHWKLYLPSDEILNILIHSKFLVDRQRRKSELDLKANSRKSVTSGARWIMVDGLVKKMVVDEVVNGKTLVDVTEEVDSAVCEV